MGFFAPPKNKSIESLTLEYLCPQIFACVIVSVNLWRTTIIVNKYVTHIQLSSVQLTSLTGVELFPLTFLQIHCNIKFVSSCPKRTIKSFLLASLHHELHSSFNSMPCFSLKQTQLYHKFCWNYKFKMPSEWKLASYRPTAFGPGSRMSALRKRTCSVDSLQAPQFGHYCEPPKYSTPQNSWMLEVS